LMAHHDSKSQSLSFPFRMGLTITTIAGAFLLASLALIAILSGNLPGPTWLAPSAGCATAIASLVLSTMSRGNHSPGGVDNAGSVAIVLAVANRLIAELADDIELVVLSTGAEEDHMIGAMRWLDVHAGSLVFPAYCLNLDGAGAPGRAVLIERYGFGRLFSAEMSAAARRASDRLGINPRGIVMLPAMSDPFERLARPGDNVCAFCQRPCRAPRPRHPRRDCRSSLRDLDGSEHGRNHRTQRKDAKAQRRKAHPSTRLAQRREDAETRRRRGAEKVVGDFIARRGPGRRTTAGDRWAGPPHQTQVLVTMSRPSDLRSASAGLATSLLHLMDGKRAPSTTTTQKRGRTDERSRSEQSGFSPATGDPIACRSVAKKRGYLSSSATASSCLCVFVVATWAGGWICVICVICGFSGRRNRAHLCDLWAVWAGG